MRPNTRTCRWLLSWWLATAAVLHAAGAETMPLATMPESGISVEVEGWAGISPHNTAGRDAGLLPLVVTITNRSRVDRVWTVEPDRLGGLPATTAMPVITIPVAAGDEAKATIYVDPGSPTTWGNKTLKVSGYGLVAGEQRFQVDAYSHAGGGASGSTPKPLFASAISSVAVSKAGKVLETYLVAGGMGLGLGRSPDDWRGWSVFSRLLFDESDWIAMPAGGRKALLDWVGLGGIAGVMVVDASPERLDAIGLPAVDPDGRRRIGAGEVMPLTWDGEAIDPADIAPFLARCTTHPKADMLADYADSSGTAWKGGFRKLFDVFGPRLLPTAAILAFLAVFGLVAGPLNVMLLAGPGRRSRMFWTTPLISLAATIFLLCLMLLRDGVGGAGARRTLGLLMPGQNGMAVIQEQFSRTGVLLGSSFPIREPSWMRPLGNVEVDSGFLEVDGRRREGDWFRSRSDQAYLLETVRPSRAKIEFVAGDDGPPSVISSIEVPLGRMFVIDEQGAYWTATDIGTGERKPLERSDADAYARWFAAVAADAGPIRGAALEAVQNRRGHAYAESATAAKAAVQTLDSIRWIDDKAVFIGPSTRAAAK